MQNERHIYLTKLLITSILGVIGFILMAYGKIPFPPATFLNIDFGDATVIIATILLGASYALGVTVIKTTLTGIFVGFEFGYISALALIFSSLIFILLTKLLMLIISKKLNENKTIDTSSKVVIVIISSIIMTLTFTVAFLIFNKYVLLPLYGMKASEINQQLLSIFVPFNLIKGSLISSIGLTVGLLTRLLLQRSHRHLGL